MGKLQFDSFRCWREQGGSLGKQTKLRSGQRLSAGIAQLPGEKEKAPFLLIHRNRLLGAAGALISSSVKVPSAFRIMGFT